MKLKLLFHSILFSLFTFLAMAQEETPSYGIKGTVLNQETDEPVSYASVILIDAGTQENVAGAVADESGEFFVRGFKDGKYLLKVSFMGYEMAEATSIEVSPSSNFFDLGSVLMSEESVALQEVTVQGQRQLIEEKVDRTIYNAEYDQTTVGGDATDVLRRVPMLSVDLDGNVSMRGSGNILVLIDNRQSAIVANNIAEALKQIPAEEIKAVEVITSPSAKYDAEGTGGVINIVTKRNKLQGLSLNLNSSAGLRGSNLGLNASAKKDKMSWTLGGFGRAGYNILGSFENDQTLIDPEGGATRIMQQADTRNNMLFGRYNFGWDYEIDKYNFLTASVSVGVRNMRNRQNGLLTDTYVEDMLLNSVLRDVTVDNLSNTIDVNFNYTKTYEKPQKEIALLGLYSRNNLTNNFTNSLYDASFDEVVNRIRNVNPGINEEFTLQLDYVTPLGDGENSILEYGAKNILRKAVSEFSYFTADGPNAPFIEEEDVTLSNEFNYDQNITAGYLSLTQGFLEHYTLKAGLRYEYTTIQADFRNSELPADIPDYGVFVPSVNIGRKLANGNMIKGAYNRRVQRPSLTFLNPNIQAANPLQVTQGNPMLDPELTDNYELSYSTYIKGSSLNLTSYFRNTSGSIQPLRVIQNDDVIFTTFENIGQERSYGLSVFSNVNISGKFSLNGSVDTYYAQLDNGIEDPLFAASNEGWVVSGRLFGNYTLPRNWQIQAFSFYRGRRVELQGSSGGFGIYSLSFNKQFNEKRGTIGFGAENFFTTEFRIRNELNTPTIMQQSVTGLRNMNFKINFSYRLGKISVDGPSRRKKRTIKNEDMKEGGGGVMIEN